MGGRKRCQRARVGQRNSTKWAYETGHVFPSGWAKNITCSMWTNSGSISGPRDLFRRPTLCCFVDPLSRASDAFDRPFCS